MEWRRESSIPSPKWVQGFRGFTFKGLRVGGFRGLGFRGLGFGVYSPCRIPSQGRDRWGEGAWRFRVTITQLQPY